MPSICLLGGFIYCHDENLRAGKCIFSNGQIVAPLLHLSNEIYQQESSAGGENRSW